MSNDNSIKQHYTSKTDEDIRFTKDKAHQTEFILTFEYIQRYLKSGMRILETGAGTGAYAIPLAEEGYQVDAVEFVDTNLEKLKSKITPQMNLYATQGDARDLSMFDDGIFDMVLCLGPLYHTEGDDRRKVVEEAIRVAKPGGLIYFAYVTNNLSFVGCVEKFDKFLLNRSNEIEEGFVLNDEFETFTFMSPEEFEGLIKEYTLEKLHHMTPDGVTRLIRDTINELSDEEFEVWLDYLRHTAEREDQIGYGEHVVYIARKS